MTDMQEKKKTCFVVCPISDDDSDIRKHSNKLLKHIIAPACFDYEVSRSDLIPRIGSITNKIINQLKNADIVIADLTGMNPNVFYEVGYRNALDLPFIPMAEKNTKLPFDLYDFHTIFYDLELGEHEKARDELIEIIKNIPTPSKIEEVDEESPVLPFIGEIRGIRF